jgi:hypothetical protein
VTLERPRVGKTTSRRRRHLQGNISMDSISDPSRGIERHGTRRRSVIWSLPSEMFAQVVASSVTYSAVLSAFGLVASGGNLRTLKSRIREEGLDSAHLIAGAQELRKQMLRDGARWQKIPIEQILVDNCSYSTKHLKERLLRLGLLENKCALCALSSSAK